MGFKCGIVGLPNVGKSTLFNALTQSTNAVAANFPFCTIEPNVALVEVPDLRLQTLAEIAGSAKTIPTYLEFVDIAGLVKGASQGSGLGNKFLGHIRQVDAIMHVVRCFEDADIVHVNGRVDPLYDIEVIETELILADLDVVERKLASTKKKWQSGDKTQSDLVQALEAMKETLDKGQLLRYATLNWESVELKGMGLLTAKPMLYVCNVLEQDARRGNPWTERVASERKDVIVVSSLIESEIAQLGSAQDRREFLQSVGLDESGLSKVITAGYKMLDLMTYFTVGPKEARAWTFTRGMLAPKAAGIIHSDFEEGFIRAEVISYQDYIAYQGEARAKEAGKMRLEGKGYAMQDADVVHFRFNKTT